MADRLTQLQDAVNQCATSSIFPGFERINKVSSSQQVQEDYAHLFATLIARTAKDIDILIDSLPSEESTAELQAASMRKLEQENQDAAEKLQEIVSFGEQLLEQIQNALYDIAKKQLDARKFVIDDLKLM